MNNANIQEVSTSDVKSQSQPPLLINAIPLEDVISGIDTACSVTTMVPVPLTRIENVTIDSNSDIFNHELDNGQPGLCVSSDVVLTWSPIKISKSRVKSASTASSGDEINKFCECLSLEYQMKQDIPGLELRLHVMKQPSGFLLHTELDRN